MDAKTHYDVLEISKDASKEEIKRAFKRLAKKYHPDVSKLAKWEAEEMFKKIAAAYDVLSDNARRRIYDQSLRFGSFQLRPRPRYAWVYLTYLDSYGWFPIYEKVWNEHHDMMYR